MFQLHSLFLLWGLRSAKKRLAFEEGFAAGIVGALAVLGNKRKKGDGVELSDETEGLQGAVQF